MRRFQGRIAFITGAGRGQGRGHALRLAREGADLALVDLGSAGSVEHPPYRTATTADLESVAAEARTLGVRVEVFEADVRDPDALQVAADAAASELGGIDLLVANAGITDAFLLIGSGVALRPVAGLSHYGAAKAGLIGLAGALAAELGPHGIRCNTVHPAGVDTDMTTAMVEFNGVPRDDLLSSFRDRQLIPRNVEIDDVTAAVTWLLSDEARFVTGLAMTVDASETKR